MPLETINYIPDLNTANPTPADGVVQGDDHLRGIKAALRNTFPNFTDAALNSTQAEVDAVAHTKQFSAQDGTSTAPSHTFGNDPTTGFYKGARIGQTAIAGTLRGAGSMPVGALVDFPKAPASLGTDWLECDGSILTISTFPDLGAFLGSTFGGDGVTTFGIPNLTDTGRFRRSRSTAVSIAVGQYLANTLKFHSHTGTANSAGDHTHTATVTDPGHAHTTYGPSGTLQNAGTVAGTGNIEGTASHSTSSSVTNITVANAVAGAHTHVLSIAQNGDSSETRPESFACISCIKT